MSNEVNLEELRDNARTNYGVTNADDLDAETLQSEIDAIDKQAEDAKEEEAQVERNAERATANSTANPSLGASDGNTALEDEDTDEEDDDEETVAPLSKQTKPELLATAESEGVEVEETDTVPVLREKIAAARADVEDEEDDDEGDEEDTTL